MKLSSSAYLKVENWMNRNARAIELSIWKVLFEKGNKESVISILKHYQNEDGGFGNALEPDSWNVNSTPYTTLYAINILKQIDYTKDDNFIYKRIHNYLRSKSDFSEELGWNFSVKSNDIFPHAPWWTYNVGNNKLENIGLTAELSAFIIENYKDDKELFLLAQRMTNTLFSKLRSQSQFGNMGINGYCILLEVVKNESLINKNEYEELYNILKTYVKTTIEYDSSKWSMYSIRPSNYIRTPDNVFYEENKEIVNNELDYLITTLNKDGVWDITWNWLENNQKYSKEFSISENWWKGIKAIENISLLRKFDRIEA